MSMAYRDEFGIADNQAKVSKMSGLESAVMALEKSEALLRECIAQLEDRVNPVLLASEPSPAPECSPHPPASPLATSLFDLANRYSMLAARIQNISRRVDT